jgi:hypothetical protein
LGVDGHLVAQRNLSGARGDKLRPALAEFFPAFVEIDFVQGSVISWQRANQIHAWIIDNCWHRDREEEINFGGCEISLVKLIVLRDVCGVVTKHRGKAGELLPTRAGPGFGSVDYDERYFREVGRTLACLDRISETPGHASWSFSYTASW